MLNRITPSLHVRQGRPDGVSSLLLLLGILQLPASGVLKEKEDAPTTKTGGGVFGTEVLLARTFRIVIGVSGDTAASGVSRIVILRSDERQESNVEREAGVIGVEETDMIIGIGFAF